MFDVKSDGWFNVLRALRGTELGTAAVFSSIAGRFGNAGQTDYSAANDLMCKSVSSLRAAGVTRGDRHRLDRMGGHRHGQPRLDPEDDGAGGDRDAAPSRSESRPFATSSNAPGAAAK